MENGNLGVHIHKELSTGFARGGFHYKKQTGGVASIHLSGQVSCRRKTCGCGKCPCGHLRIAVEANRYLERNGQPCTSRGGIK